MMRTREKGTQLAFCGRSALPVRGVDAGAPQTSPVLFGAKTPPGNLRVNSGVRGSPAEQAIEGKQNRGCNRNQNPPVHAWSVQRGAGLPRAN
jgi:hypothetical protein